MIQASAMSELIMYQVEVGVVIWYVSASGFDIPIDC